MKHHPWSKWSKRLSLGIAWCLVLGLSVACGPEGSKESDLQIPRRTGPPYSHRTPSNPPYDHRSQSGSQIQYGIYGGIPTTGTVTGLQRYLCSCLIQSSDIITARETYYVCANDPIDAASFASSKCPVTKVCYACACYPGPDCTSRGD